MRWTATSEGTTVTYERHGIVERRATIESSATGYRLIDETGVLLAEAEMGHDGTLTVLDQECQVVSGGQVISGLHLRSHASAESRMVR